MPENKQQVEVLDGEQGYQCPACGRVLGFLSNENGIAVRSHVQLLDYHCPYDNRTFYIKVRTAPAEVV